MKISVLIGIISLVMSGFGPAYATELYSLDHRAIQSQRIYNQLSGPVNKPDFELFHKAYQGYDHLNQHGKVKNKLLTLIDFSIHSSKKRLWIIDMESHEIIFHTYVAHGRNSGDGMGIAKKFSNTPHSLQSSLGFYLTAETYYGKHGLSLNLDGQENGINHLARQRRIVMHGADYATAHFVKKYGRLGRSYGCPAIPAHLHKSIINKIKDGSVMFIGYPDEHYEKSSRILNRV